MLQHKTLQKLLKYFIREHSLIARIAAWKLSAASVAIVIGRTIHLHNTNEAEFLTNRRWVRHELTHVEQFKKYGMVNFIFLYLLESIKKGYYNNRFEVEARLAENIAGLETKYLLVKN